MTRAILVRVHLAAAAEALVVISAFLVSSVVTELFGSPADIRGLTRRRRPARSLRPTESAEMVGTRT